jgi:hypothetical protein
MLRLLRILLVLLALAVLLPVSADDPVPLSTAENPLTLSVRDMHISEVLKVIAQQSHAKVGLGNGLWEKTVSLELTNVTVEEAFTALAKNAGLVWFKDQDRYIVDTATSPGYLAAIGTPRVQIWLHYVALWPGTAFLPLPRPTAHPNASLPPPGSEVYSLDAYVRRLCGQGQVVNEPRVTTLAEMPTEMPFTPALGLQATLMSPQPTDEQAAGNMPGATWVTAHAEPDQSLTLKLEFTRGDTRNPVGTFQPPQDPFTYYAQSALHLGTEDVGIIRGLPGTPTADGRLREIVVVVTAKVLPPAETF